MRTVSKQNKIGLLVAAGFGVLPLASLLIAADPPNPAPAAMAEDQSASFNTPGGFEPKKLDAQSGIRSGLVKVTERAVTKGDFNSLLAELTTQDKERAREFKGADQGKLDGIIGQIPGGVEEQIQPGFQY